MTDKQDCCYHKTGKQKNEPPVESYDSKTLNTPNSPAADQNTAKEKSKTEETSTGADICKVHSRRQCYM